MEALYESSACKILSLAPQVVDLIRASNGSFGMLIILLRHHYLGLLPVGTFPDAMAAINQDQ